MSTTPRFTDGYDGIIKQTSLARSKRKPDMQRHVPPVGVGGFLADVDRPRLERLARQTRNGKVPLHVLSEIRRDPQVRLGLNVVKAPLFGADIWAECEDQAEKALVEEVFVNRLMRNLMRSSLLSYDYGFSPHEVNWTVGDILVEWADEDGRPAQHNFESQFLVHSVNEVFPGTVEILRETDTWKFGGLQIRIGSGDLIRLDPVKCFVHANEPEFGNLYGQPRTEFCHKPWFAKEHLWYYANRYFEQSGGPQVKAFVNTEEEVFDESGSVVEDPLAYFAEKLPGVIRSSSVVVIPGDFDERTGKRIWDMEYMQGDARGAEFALWADHLDTQILRALICPDRTVTQGEKGAYSQSKTHAEMHLRMANEGLLHFLENINDNLLPDFMRLNGLKSRVRLVSDGIAPETEETLKAIMLKAMDVEAAALTAMQQGSLDPEVTRQLASLKIDAAKLLKNLNVPVRKENTTLAAEISSSSGPENRREEEKSPEEGRTGGGELSRSDLAAETVPLGDWDALYLEMLLAEETLLSKKTERYREQINRTEKATQSIALAALLAAKRLRPDGSTVSAAADLAGLVYGPTGGLLPINVIARNSDRVITMARELLPSLDGTMLTTQGNRQLIAGMKRDIDQAGKGFLDGLRGIRSPRDFLADARKAAGKDWKKATRKGAWGDTALGKAAAKNLEDAEAAAAAGLRDIEEANLAGFERNIENIGIRSTRQLSEQMENAFHTKRELAKGKGLLEEILAWHLHPNYTDLSLEAHWRAVYRKTWLEMARSADLKYFRQYHPPITVQGENESCRQNDGVVGTYAHWGRVASGFGTADPLDQFGMHYGCRAFWFPIPADTLIEEGVSVAT